MGWNTSVIVMNDALSGIEQDPDFGKNLTRAIMEVQRGKTVDVSARSKNLIFSTAATVIETHHADQTAIVAMGGNCGSVLGEYWADGHHKHDVQLEILKKLANDWGYNLHKKPKSNKEF